MREHYQNANTSRTILRMQQQEKHPQWAWQWDKYYDDNKWLFTEWIKPWTLEDFRGKDVLDCGCGGGQHLSFVAPYAKSVTGVDLNAWEIARKNNANAPNVTTMEGDIATMDLPQRYDAVYCIGVLHHTDSPDASFKNIARHAKPGGRVIVWVYSVEGNFLNRTLVEGSKKLLIGKLPRSIVHLLSHVLTTLVYVPVYTLYLLPLTFLPYYEYFQNWRKLGYSRNLLNVFDKLNAPQTEFITEARIRSWFPPEEYDDVSITPYRGVSWRGSGTRKA